MRIGICTLVCKHKLSGLHKIDFAKRGDVRKDEIKIYDLW